jgi:prepilin-type N-terminal cleavage/methylation domain-containing protein
MSGMTDRQRRRGMSLVELLAAMTAASVVIATSAVLVHRSFTFEARSRQVLADERAALTLARQFRADVHAAPAVQSEPGLEAKQPLVAFDGPAGRVTYQAVGSRLVRLVEPLAGAVGREDYVFSRPLAWAVEVEGGLVTLRGAATSEAVRQPRFAVEVVATCQAPPGAVP